MLSSGFPAHEEKLQVRLAVSLHTPDDELRNTLVPVSTRWDVAEVLEAARGYAEDRGSLRSARG